MVFDPQSPGQIEQSFTVALAFARDQVGMGRANDPVDRIGVARDNRRQRLDRALQALARAKQAERHQYLAAIQAHAPLELLAAPEGPVGRTVRDHLDRRGNGAIAFDQQVAAMAAHDHDARGAGDQVAQDPLLPR